ncbi:MAG TPA: hypothetical protein VE685_05740 [Thermoanaerobaculia bacterium]|nr:hypothetical protein [Thermoanaerobaculia bacterium]
MNKQGPFVMVCLLVALALSPAYGQELVLEPEDDVDALQRCDSVHVIKTCETSHYDPVTFSEPGGLVRLDDKLYEITWMGPGYYLSSGEILHPLGGDSLSGLLVGQRWVEIHPEEGRIHVSRSWQDADLDGALSRADSLVFTDGLVRRVRDVRLNLRVRPVEIE